MICEAQKLYLPANFRKECIAGTAGYETHYEIVTVTQFSQGFQQSKMILMGGLAATVRWAMTGEADGLPLLVVLQALHAFTFAATHLGAIYFISRRVPKALSASAQGVYSATVMGLALGVAMFASGKLYDLFGSGAYHAMAVMAAGGAILAIFLAIIPRSDDNKP